MISDVFLGSLKHHWIDEASQSSLVFDKTSTYEHKPVQVKQASCQM